MSRWRSARLSGGEAVSVGHWRRAVAHPESPAAPTLPTLPTLPAFAALLAGRTRYGRTLGTPSTPFLAGVQPAIGPGAAVRQAQDMDRGGLPARPTRGSSATSPCSWTPCCARGALRPLLGSARRLGSRVTSGANQAAGPGCSCLPMSPPHGSPAPPGLPGTPVRSNPSKSVNRGHSIELSH